MNLFLGFLSAVFLIAALFTGFSSVKFLKGARVIEGTIVGVDNSVDSSGGEASRRSYPIIGYTDFSGNKKTFTAKIAALNCEVGSAVFVARREDGTDKLISLGELFMLPAFFSLFGSVLFLLVFPLSNSSQIAYSLARMLNLLRN